MRSKILVTAFLFLIVASLIGCSNSEVKEETENTEVDGRIMKEELDNIYDMLQNANSLCDDLGKTYINSWSVEEGTKKYVVFMAFFSENARDEYIKTHNVKNYKEYIDTLNDVWKTRDSINNLMPELKTALKQLDNVPDEYIEYYNSVKELYICVDAYYNLVINFPEGYSLTSYSKAISEHGVEYQKLVSAIELEK